MSFPSDKTADARGSLCPIPTVKASLALEDMSSGQVLEVLSDDPATKRDLPAWCREMGHVLLGVEEDGPASHFFIRKKND